MRKWAQPEHGLHGIGPSRLAQSQLGQRSPLLLLPLYDGVWRHTSCSLTSATSSLLNGSPLTETGALPFTSTAPPLPPIPPFAAAARLGREQRSVEPTCWETLRALSFQPSQR